MKNSLLCSLLFSAACGPVSELELQAPELAGDSDAASEPEALRGALVTAPRTLLGTDCGTVVPPAADGTYVLSEISQLQAIDTSGCSYFNGNVRVAFTVPLVPSSQRYLFQVKNIVSVSGTISQAVTKQYVTFDGLESAGRIEVGPSGTCGCGALKTVGTLRIARDCYFPALQQAGRIEIDSKTVSGFPALQSAPDLTITSTDSLAISGFKALTQAGTLRITGSSLLTAHKTTGSFPKLETVERLEISRSDLTGFTLPKLTTVTGDLRQLECRKAVTPLAALQTVGGTWYVAPGKYADTSLVGPPQLASLGALDISFEAVLRLSGFPRLTTVTRSLSVRGAMDLKVSGFDELTSAGAITFAGSYMAFSGFSKLARMTGNLAIHAWNQSAYPDDKFSAFNALTEVQGAVVLTLDKPATSVFPMLKTVQGSMLFRERNVRPTAYSGFPKLETVGGVLTVENQGEAFNALKRVEGTLEILEVPGSFSGNRISGFKKLTFVGGDLVFDKKASTLDTQRLLDRLVGFTGAIVLK